MTELIEQLAKRKAEELEDFGGESYPHGIPS